MFLRVCKTLMCVCVCLGDSHSGSRPGESWEAAGVQRRFYRIAEQRHQTCKQVVVLRHPRFIPFCLPLLTKCIVFSGFSAVIFVCSRHSVQTRRIMRATLWTASLNGAIQWVTCWMTESCSFNKPRTATEPRWWPCCLKVRINHI